MQGKLCGFPPSDPPRMHKQHIVSTSIRKASCVVSLPLAHHTSTSKNQSPFPSRTIHEYSVFLYTSPGAHCSLFRNFFCNTSLQNPSSVSGHCGTRSRSEAELSVSAEPQLVSACKAQIKSCTFKYNKHLRIVCFKPGYCLGMVLQQSSKH